MSARHYGAVDCLIESQWHTLRHDLPDGVAVESCVARLEAKGVGVTYPYRR